MVATSAAGEECHLRVYWRAMLRSDSANPTLQARRRGCLGGCFTNLLRIVLILALGVVLIGAIDAVFAPWSFFLGGHFHYFPYWQGWGRVHTASGDYILRVQFSPSPGSKGSATAGYPHVSGYGWLCTPSGDKIRLRGYGMFADKHIGIHPDGRRMYFSVHRTQMGWRVISPDYRPNLGFHATWQGNTLVGDDGGTFAQAFAPDGGLYEPHQARQLKEVVPITLKEEDSWWSTPEFDAACAAVARK
jgi:hypothetical protein